MNLIITGGNSGLFNELKLFVTSLRENGRYEDRIVVCDNSIEGEYGGQCSFVEEATFSKEQLDFFREHEVEVVVFHELLKKHGVTRDMIDPIQNMHRAYPFKLVYSCLISKEYLGRAENTCFFDADVYFQKQVKEVLDDIKDDVIYVARERKKIGEVDLLVKWMRVTDLSFGIPREHYEDVIFNRKTSLNTGFIGGRTEVFNSLMITAWIMASSRIVRFHSDQPIVNYMDYLNYPIKPIPASHFLNLCDIPEKNIKFDESTRMFRHKSDTPNIVHFNGENKYMINLLVPDNVKIEGPLFNILKGFLGVRSTMRVYKFLYKLGYMRLASSMHK
ncbi:MAG: hypothetical protein ABIH11_01965 [Candidatus Altiarchaeota archaeon]